jgi:Fe-S cluster biogenesis protein NfuA
VNPDASPLDAILDRTEELLEAVDALPEAERRTVIELLDTVDEVHRLALVRLGHALPPAEIERLRDAHPAIAWLWEVYGVGLDPRTLVERALATIRPYVSSHGGEVEVLDVEGGRVTVQLGGACVGCSASAVTLQHGVEAALRAGYPDFRELAVHEPGGAASHAPPGPTLLQIDWHPEASRAAGT